MNEEQIIDQKANLIVDALIEDIMDRRGIGDEWFVLDTEVELEIVECWVKTIKSILHDVHVGPFKY